MAQTQTWENEYKSPQLVTKKPEPQNDVLRFFKYLKKEAKIELAGLQAEIKNSFPMEFADYVAKWVALENLHLTLLFLGEVEGRNVEKLKSAVLY